MDYRWSGPFATALYPVTVALLVVVLFYGSNTWTYTRLGRIGLPEEEVAALLSGGNVTVWIGCG